MNITNSITNRVSESRGAPIASHLGGARRNLTNWIKFDQLKFIAYFAQIDLIWSSWSIYLVNLIKFWQNWSKYSINYET